MQKPDITIGNRIFTFNRNKKYIIGIINCTPDSFSDGGEIQTFSDFEKKIDVFIENDVDIIELGGESSRPGAKYISPEVEWLRIKDYLNYVKKYTKIPVSIDTRKEFVIKQAYNAGMDLLNDITGLRYKKIRALVKKYDIPVIAMHMQGTPENMQDDPNYKSVVDDIKEYFFQVDNTLESEGIDTKKIILDPGIGFGKTFEHNIELLKEIKMFNDLNKPLCLGTSRKSFLHHITKRDVKNRDHATDATTVWAILNDVDFIRVHNVAAANDIRQVISYLI